MKVVTNQWSPLFKSLKVKVSPSGKRKLLGQMIDELYNISVLNFGDTGVARPSPFSPLKDKYALEWKDGDSTPDLLMSFHAHQLRNPDVQYHMVDSFRTTVEDNTATLRNISPYFNQHQFGKGKIYRPTMPITEDGSDLTQFAKDSLVQTLDEHFQT